MWYSSGSMNNLFQRDWLTPEKRRYCMGTTTKRFNILDEANQGFKVYHVEEMKDLFKGREKLPSYRMFSTDWGKNGHIGLKQIEEEYNRSWYSCVKERWMKKKPNQM